MKGSHVRSKLEPQRRKLKYFKMSLFCFTKGTVSISGMGFLQVRMVGMRKSNKRKKLKKKDGERNFHSASRPPEVQARRVEWKKWTSFNAGVILDRRGSAPTHRCRVRDLSRAMGGRQTKTHICEGDKDYVCVPAMYKCRLVGSGNFETTEGLRTDSRGWRRGFAQYCLQLVCTSPWFHSLVWFHERIFSRTRNWSNLAVPYPSWRYSGRGSCKDNTSEDPLSQCESLQGIRV